MAKQATPLIQTDQERDLLVRSIVDGNGQSIYNSFGDLKEALTAVGVMSDAGVSNAFYPALTNKLSQQFVLPIMATMLRVKENHYKGQFTYGDKFEYIFSQMNNILRFNDTYFTPKEYTDAGGKLKNKQIAWSTSSFIHIMSGIQINRHIVEAAFTPGTIPAFNALIANITSSIMRAVNLWLYDQEIKVIKQIANTYTMRTAYPNPLGASGNKTQWKLAYIKYLIQQMKQPSLAFSALGKVGDAYPAAYEGKKDSSNKIVAADLVPRTINNIDELILYTSPKQAAEFETLAYSTTFNQQFIELSNLKIVSLNIDKQQPAASQIDGTLNKMAAEVAKQAAADDYQTAYLVARSAIDVLDRFEVTTTTKWLTIQWVQMFVYYCTYAVIWQEVGIKIDLKPA